VLIRKYPRTPHLAGSALQTGDDGTDRITIRELRSRYPDAELITEEKLDGANCGISFCEELDLTVQSRGHVLRGGAREAQFGPLKAWTAWLEGELLEILEDRYVMYGEWMFARHTLFYDRLPHLFHEFDIYDRREDRFLSTPARRDLLSGSRILSVPVLSEAWPGSDREINGLIRPALYRSEGWRDALAEAAERSGVDAEQALRETGASDLSEGLYLKVERDGATIARYKLVRDGFVQTILESGTHWHDRPIIRNGLAPGVNIMAEPDRPAPDF
jgi:hypothetical protein